MKNIDSFFTENNNYLKYAYLVFLIIISFYYSYISYNNFVINLLDSMQFFRRAENLNFTFNSEWVNGFYPFGYPLVLKLLTFITNDYLLSSKIINLIFGIFTLHFFYLILKHNFNEVITFIGLLILGLNPVFINLVTSDNSDIPSLFFITTSSYYYIKFLGNREIKYLIFSGIGIGLATYFRYTALITIPGFVLSFLLFDSRTEDLLFLRRFIIFFSSILVILLPLFVVNYVHTEKLFYTLQHQNVWFGIYGEKNWGLNWIKSSNYSDITQVINLDQNKFYLNWFSNILKSLFHDFYGIPFSFFWLLGLVILIKEKSVNKLLFSSLFFSYVLFLSIAFVDERLLIPFFICQVIFICVLFDFFISRLRANKYLLSISLIVSVLAIGINYKPFYRINNPTPVEFINNKEINNYITENKLDKSNIITLSFQYYDLDSKLKNPYSLPWQMSPFFKWNSHNEMLQYMINHGYKYILADYSTVDNIRGVSGFWWSMINEMPEFMKIIYRNNNGAFIIEVESDFFNHNTLSSYEDWQAFLNSNPIQLTDSSYYQRIRDPYFHLVHQKDGPWEGLEWYKDNLFPAWVRYKTDRNLF